MAKNIYIHVHSTKDDGERLYQHAAGQAAGYARQALAKTASFSEKLYKESGENNEHGINARYYLEKAIAELLKV